jgi:hypothetical protein
VVEQIPLERAAERQIDVDPRSVRAAAMDPATRIPAIALSNMLNGAVGARKAALHLCAGDELDVGFSIPVFRIFLDSTARSARVTDVRFLEVREGRPLSAGTLACMAQDLRSLGVLEPRRQESFLGFSGHLDVPIALSRRGPSAREPEPAKRSAEPPDHFLEGARARRTM